VLPFKPSNVDLAALGPQDLRDVSIVEGECSVSAFFSCGRSVAIRGHEQTTPHGTKVIVYAMKSLKIGDGADVTIGPNDVPVVFIAVGGIDISGTVRVIPGNAGGARSVREPFAPGAGPGGGVGASAENTRGAGGATHCGLGGRGSPLYVGAFGPSAASPYGAPELSPLVGGSAGGNGLYSWGGDGGGAVQFVAGTALNVSPRGRIMAEGGDAAFSEHTGENRPPAGGGSGGAILLEAPTVRAQGTLSVDGGKGSFVSGWQGSRGGAGGSAVRASGGDAPPFAVGTGFGGGAGGGGLGRVRINTSDGRPDPHASACETWGRLTTN